MAGDGYADEVVARATRILLGRTGRTVGVEFFQALARGLAETLETRFGFVGELVDATAPAVRTLALWTGDGYAENFTYGLDGTPCANVMAGEFCHFPSGVAARFPRDTLLVDMGVESYLGVPIPAPGGPVGLLVAMHDAATSRVPELASVFALFADRASAELERLRFESELARSEARYRQIVTSCLEGVWTIDAAAVTTFVNAQMARMLGYSVAEMVGRPLFDFMDAAGRTEAEHNLARRASGVAEHHEFRFIHRDGHDVWMSIAASPLSDDAGRYTGALALATDVTERRRRDAAAQQAQRLESLGVLAGGVAHDFNNLLVGILGNSELLLRDASPPRDALEDIRTAALRAAELTHQLLAFAGKATLDLTSVDLTGVVIDMARLLSAGISKKISLRLPPSNERHVVRGDAGQLSQVVMNLVTNASEAIGDRPGTLTVSTDTVLADRDYLQRVFGAGDLAPGRYVLLEVSDTGCGMDSATRDKIFDPFFTTKFTGRGLGLAALLGAVRGHGGVVAVESEVGVGTTFRVLLPSADDPPADVAPVVPVHQEARSGGGHVVLVADDEAVVLAVCARLLEAEGYRVITAVDGTDALQKYRGCAADIDLVVLDLTMPGLSGYQVFAEILRIRPDARVLVTSGYSETDVVERLNASPRGFLSKPWTVDQLFDRVRRALGDG